MNVLEDKSPVLFRLHSPGIDTNAVSGEAALRHISHLGFSLINVSSESILFDEAQEGGILLSFLLGQSSECLFPDNAAQSDLGAIYGPAPFLSCVWSRHPLHKNRMRALLALQPGSRLELAPGQIISFRWEGITTTSPEGFAPLTMTFPGITRLESVSLSQELIKQRIYANIAKFYASPSGGAPGSRISLHWKAENADSGYILPPGKQVIPNTKLSDSFLDVTLTQNTHYYFNIRNAHGNVYRETYAQLIPPCIASFSVNSLRQLTWEVHFANQVRLKTDGDYKEVEPTGQTDLTAKTDTVSILCTGLYTLERHIAIPSCAGIQTYQLDVWTFSSHQCAILTWETAENGKREIYAQDASFYPIDAPAQGVYEQVYDKGMTVGFQLKYTDDFNTEQLFLSNFCFQNRRCR